MTFEFDSSKSQSDLGKYGIDFDKAQVLWNDEGCLEIPAKALDESRFLIVGKINNIYWSAVITYRGENIRIILVKRSCDEEIDIYESS